MSTSGTSSNRLLSQGFSFESEERADEKNTPGFPRLCDPALLGKIAPF